MPENGRAHENGTALTTPTSTARGLERERITGIQRTRMLTAMAEVACEHGASNVTVAHVVQRAGVSRRTFYELFTDREDCFLAACEAALVNVSGRVLDAYRSHAGWRERIRASLLALLCVLDDEPHVARLLIVETLAGGRVSLERRSEVLTYVIDALEEGAGERGAVPGATRLTAEGVAGAVLSVLHGRLSEERDAPLSQLVNPLMSMIVLPYLGPAAARRELQREPAKTMSRSARIQAASVNPLKDLRMRLTYRTVRVLTAVASNPGASNRTIADASEISDQGQISKLLARLHRFGLVENAGASAGRGEPNAWMLTQRGWQVHGALGEPAGRA